MFPHAYTHAAPVGDADGALQVQAGQASQHPQRRQPVICHMAVIVQVDVAQITHAAAGDLQQQMNRRASVAK
jgi:hypothetical protein